MFKNLSIHPINILKLSAFFVFIARGYQHLFWDVPYRSLLWDQSLMEDLVNRFGMSWDLYVTNPGIDNSIQIFIKAIGVIYIIIAISCLLYTNKTKRYLKWMLVFGGLGLTFLAFLFFKEKFYQVGQFFEYSIQFCLPFILIYCYSKRFSKRYLLIGLKLIIALTFISHGLYALGYYSTPGLYIDMLISFFSVSENTAKSILLVAGIMDIALLPLLFIKRSEQFALLYAFVWGFLTALARLTGNFSFDFIIASLHQYLFEVILRLAHGLVPLATYLIITKDTLRATLRPNLS